MMVSDAALMGAFAEGMGTLPARPGVVVPAVLGSGFRERGAYRLVDPGVELDEARCAVFYIKKESVSTARQTSMPVITLITLFR